MLKSLSQYLIPAVTALSSLFLVSCDAIFDYEGDCSNNYRIRFVYDMNLKWADAFPSEVKSVNLYIFDQNGLFVTEIDESGEALSKPGFCIEFDDNTIAPGNYTFVAWCGLVNDGKSMESFTVPTPVPGVTTLEDLTCKLNTLQNEQYPNYSKNRLHFMYHGMLKANLPDTKDGSTYDYTIYLTKDTNHIRIILQEISGYDLKEDDYIITIEASDGNLAYNNDLLADNPTVTYLPWDQTATEMGYKIENGTIKYNLGLMADLTVSRMMDSQHKSFALTVIDKKGERIIARVPVIDYALLAKNYYNEAYGHDMTNQEFLDREDEYEMTFFLEKGQWINSYIDINSWRVVLHDYGIGK